MTATSPLVGPQQQAAVDELLAMLRLHRRGEQWVGRTPGSYGPVVFGGIGLAMTISAACHDAPPDGRLHSIHAHFLRPVQGDAELAFTGDVVKAGRTFNVHSVTAIQDGKPVITMTCSFTVDGEGYVYDLSGIPDDVPLPDAIDEPDNGDEPWPWEQRWVGPSPLRADGTREATHRHWFRLPRNLRDHDPHVHAALVGYATDWTGVGGRPLQLDGDTTGMISLDHAAWFHRPARIDDWLLQDVQSLVNHGGRGLLRGVIRNTSGQIVASMAQEMLLRPVPAS